MKIQELAIIFVIIILPISLVLSAYAQYQIQTLNTQTLYDTQLTAATYDAIKAYQINAENSTTAELSNSKIRDIEASVSTFRNSIMSSFRLNGYSEEDIDNYIPALVYTMYDGFYIYSPYENVNHQEDEDGNKIQGNGETQYGLKPYIPYSCRYVKGTSIDVVITYALDNYITVQGMINGEYVNKSGYLIDNINYNDVSDEVTYNGITIGTEQLTEEIGGAYVYPYVKINGTKYYKVGNEIIYFLNGTRTVQCTNNDADSNNEYDKYSYLIDHNNQAKEYYKEAHEFTNWLRGTELNDLQYKHAQITDINGNSLYVDDDRYIFRQETTKNIENELSNFNEHRLAIIRNVIESNLSIAIANYNAYSGSTTYDFQMPKLKEDEWENITHNIALISFLQGLNIGGKVYNGYTIVTNSESKEVVLEPNIYILGTDGDYHKIGDVYIVKDDGSIIGDRVYSGINSTNDSKNAISAGRLNLDFKRKSIINNSNAVRYYYPLKDYNASYASIIMQNNVDTYDDIYDYVNNHTNDRLKEAFYTALGRERQAQYKSNFVMSTYINSVNIPTTP